MTQAVRRPARPLRLYFAALAALLVLVAAGAGAYVFAQSAANAKQAGLAEAAFAARKAAAQLSSDLKFIDSTLAPIAAAQTTSQLLSNPAGCTLGFAPVGVLTAGHIDIVRLDGSVACTSQATKPSTALYAGQPWLHAAAGTVVGPLADSSTGSMVAIIVFPLLGDGDLAWFVDLATVGPRLGQQFESAVQKLEFLVTSADGRLVMARSIDPARWIGSDTAGTRFATADNATERVDLNGTPRLYGQATVSSGWKVYVGADKATALGAAANLQEQLFGIIAVGLIAVMVGIFFATRLVARPITALSEAVRASRGLIARPTVPVKGPAEVATLGEDINSLLRSLERELAERHRAESNYTLLFENHPEPMWVYDIASLRFVEVNEAAIRRYGYSRDEFLHMTIEAIRPASELPALGEALASLDPVSHSGSWIHRTKSGSLLDVEITSHVVDFAGIAARFVMARDVTEEKKLARQLQQAQRLESVGQLAGGVAHDFNNLLSVILNVTAQLKADLAASDDDQRWAASTRDLERVEKAAQSATRLTRQLLAFARTEVVQGTVLSISEQVEGLTELLRRTLGSHVILKATLPETVWPVKMDPGHLEQIVINLAVNSRDAMPKGGTISISTENITVDEAYALGRPDLSPGRYVQLQVADTGTGMDQVTLDHMFEPFFTTKPVGHGTGLGLATVYGIVKQLKGHIGVYSEPGHGTTVTVLIPVTEAAMPEKPSAVLVHRDPGSGCVLVVEDYADLRQLLQEILEQAGYRVLVAPDGAAGLNLAREHAGEIDVLLTDIVMPNMLGPDLADQLKAENPGLRVLFMSGHAQPALGTTVLDPGTQLLQKPFMEDELLDKLQSVIAAPAGGGLVGIS